MSHFETLVPKNKISKRGKVKEKKENLEKLKRGRENATCGGPLRSIEIDTLALSPSFRIVFYDVS